VKNVFDTQRIKSISQANDQQAAAAVLGYTNPANQLAAGTPLDSNYRTGIVTLPREIGVTLRYRFGGSGAEPEASPRPTRRRRFRLRPPPSRIATWCSSTSTSRT